MKQRKILITGGAGFLGTHLVRYLLQKGDLEIVVFDQLQHHKPEDFGKKVAYCKGNITLKDDVENVFKVYGPFETVYHLAAVMPDKSAPDNVLWETNVTGTINLISEAVKYGVSSFIFTSSNVAYGIPKSLPVTEETELHPLEIYGRSKKRAEEELSRFKKQINIQIFRCPVISGIGRLGLQAILFEFISENRNVYVLGDGNNKYQFTDALDVASALEKASHIRGFDIYNIGADEVISLREMYQRVIDFAGSTSRIISLPKSPSLFFLSILDKLNISPLGVYQYTMIGRSMYADTKKIKEKLDWKPKITNVDTFIENYKWYRERKGQFTEIGSGTASSNRSLPKMGAFKVLKMFS